MGWGTIFLVAAIVVFALVAATVVGPTIEGLQCIPLGLALFAASFLPFGEVTINRKSG